MSCAAARCVDFIPLFLKPTDPEDTLAASAVLDSLQTLDVQCRVFKRNAEDFSESPLCPLKIRVDVLLPRKLDKIMLSIHQTHASSLEIVALQIALDHTIVKQYLSHWNVAASRNC